VTSGLFGNIDGGKTLPNGQSIVYDAYKPEEVYNFEKACKFFI
jgi:hypothetical protein